MFKGNKTLIAIAVSAGLISIAGAVYLFKFRETADYKPTKNKAGPCPGETRELVMADQHMDGILKKNQKYKLIENWYSCHPLVKGDLVLYQFSTSLDPVVRVLRAVPGDEFRVTRDQKMGAWNIEVNGELLMDEPNQRPYFFGAKPPATLSLYEKANNGKILEGDIVVFSSVPPGNNDSGLFGIANVADVIGKVEPISD